MVNLDDQTTTSTEGVGTSYYLGKTHSYKYKDTHTVHVYDLKSLQKQKVLTAKKKAADNLKNGWGESKNIILNVHIQHDIKKVIRNCLPVKVRE